MTVSQCSLVEKSEMGSYLQLYTYSSYRIRPIVIIIISELEISFSARVAKS